MLLGIFSSFRSLPSMENSSPRLQNFLRTFFWNISSPTWDFTVAICSKHKPHRHIQNIVWFERVGTGTISWDEKMTCGLKDVKSTAKLHWTWQKAVNNTRWKRQRGHQQGLRAPLLLLSCSAGLWARCETISILEHLCLEAAVLIDCLGCSADRDELIPTQRSPTRTNEWSKQKHKPTNTFKSPECVCVCVQYMLTEDGSTPYPKLPSHLFMVWLPVVFEGNEHTATVWPSGQMHTSWFTDSFFKWWRTSAARASLKIKTWQT